MPRSIRSRLSLLALAVLVEACIPGPRPDPYPIADQPAPQPASAAPDPQLATADMPPVDLLPAAGPPPFAVRPVTPNAVESVAATYTVQPGDTLRRISDKTNAASEAIARANELAPPFTIRAGQRLTIPAGRWHQVRAGETGIAIARAYGVEWTRIAATNQLTEPYILRTGQRLQLPSSGEVAQMSIEQRAAAFKLDIGDLITGGEPAIAQNAKPVAPVKTTPRAAPLPATVAVAPARPFTGRFDWPTAERRLIRGFGPFGAGRHNDGVNIGTSLGSPILAAADGVVTYSGTDISAYGGLILIRHSDKYTTAYGHAAELLVTRGQAVKRGQIIARAGESGAVDRPQLHFEIRQGAKPVDPAQYLPKRS